MLILLRTDGPILQGEPAFALINRLVNKTTFWDRIVIGANSSRPVSRIIYPLAYLGRKIVLMFKGISPKLPRVDLR